MIIVKLTKRLNTAERIAVKDKLRELKERDARFRGCEFRVYHNKGVNEVYSSDNRLFVPLDDIVMEKVEEAL